MKPTKRKLQEVLPRFLISYLFFAQQKDDKNLHKKQEEKTKESDVIKKIIKERQKEQADNTLQKKHKRPQSISPITSTFENAFRER